MKKKKKKKKKRKKKKERRKKTRIERRNDLNLDISLGGGDSERACPWLFLA